MSEKKEKNTVVGHSHSCACEDSEHFEETKREKIIALVFGALLFAAGYVLSEFFSVNEFAYLICFGISYLLVGFGVIRDAVDGILHRRFFDENFLITLASLGAFAIKEYHEGCAVMLLFTFGEFLQAGAVAKSRKRYNESAKKTFEKMSDAGETNKFITKFSHLYTPIICILAVLTFVIKLAFFDGSLHDCLYKGLSVLVIGCPCAIVISVPLCISGGIGVCSAHGIYFRDTYSFENFGKRKSAKEYDGVMFSGDVDYSIEKGKAVSRKSLLLAKENVVFSLAVKAVIFCFVVFSGNELPMWLAVFGDVGVAVIAVLNSLRIKV